MGASNIPVGANELFEIEEGATSSAAPSRWRPIEGRAGLGLSQHLVENKKLAHDEMRRVLTEATGILERCADPVLERARLTGLVCGYVQSGKTMSMAAVSALARDNGYRIIVLIAGTTNNLVAQSRDRMQDDLRAATHQWDWVMWTNPREQEIGHLQGLLAEWRDSTHDDQNKRTLFITVMKNVSHLHALTDLLADVELTGIPALVFDDEADQAGLNTRPLDTDASATYRHIESLRRSLPHHSYLQYTATPQAPLLISRADALSAEFAELVSPGTRYTGGEIFFGGATELVDSIPPSEILPDNNLPEEAPATLTLALRLYFIGVASGLINGDKKHRSMLIHPSQKTAVHRHYHHWVNTIKQDWFRVLASDHDADRDTLVDAFLEAHGALRRTWEQLEPFDHLLRHLPAALNRTMVTIVNSVDGREVQWDNSYSHILVGGEKLGRGYTVKGLTVTYMPRPPGGWTADTIQQRARFFGYHAGYLGLCRVFLHPDVRDAYVAYVAHERHMRRALGRHRGMPLKEWRRVFYLDSQLRPTRHNVLSTPYLRARLENGWFWSRAPHVSPNDGGANRQLVEHVLASLTFNDDDASNPRHKVTSVPLREVFQALLVELSFVDERDSVDLCAVNCQLADLLDAEPDATCDIYWMDPKQKRTRALNENGHIPQLFQGRSSKGAESYPGDRFYCDSTKVTVQIHLLDVTLEDGRTVLKRVPAVAVRLPSVEDIIVQPEG
jgi:hypothetical protein